MKLPSNCALTPDRPSFETCSPEHGVQPVLEGLISHNVVQPGRHGLKGIPDRVRLWAGIVGRNGVDLDEVVFISEASKRTIKISNKHTGEGCVVAGNTFVAKDGSMPVRRALATCIVRVSTDVRMKISCSLTEVSRPVVL